MSSTSLKSWKYAAFGAVIGPFAAHAGSIPTIPPVNFTNSSTASVGATIVNLLDSYATLMQYDPRLQHGGGVMDQNIETVVRMTRSRTQAQTLAAIHDDRTAQPYSVLNGLGMLTSYFMTGIGSSTSGTAPARLTPTSYVITTLQDYAPTAQGINYLNAATIGFATFGDGTATPLAAAANFLNNTIRNNASTEPPKRTFDRYMGSTLPVTNPASIKPGVISPLDARYGNYSAVSNKAGLTTADTAPFVVPTYFSNFTVPSAYGNTVNWVRGFTVTQAMVTANTGALHRSIRAGGRWNGRWRSLAESNRSLHRERDKNTSIAVHIDLIPSIISIIAATYSYTSPLTSTPGYWTLVGHSLELPNGPHSQECKSRKARGAQSARGEG